MRCPRAFKELNFNIPIAICSNLAFPYGAAIDLLLKDHQLLKVLSYETGFIKPEPGIYQAAINQLQLPPEDCLFVGDTLLADYDGPRAFGMRSFHLTRNLPSKGNSISSLADILITK